MAWGHDMLETQPVPNPACVRCRLADTAEADSDHDFCAFEFPFCEGCPNARHVILTVGREEDPMKSKIMSGWIASNSGQHGADATGRDHSLQAYIHRENLALLNKRLTETCTETRRKMLMKLLAQEEAKNPRPKRASTPR